MKVLHVISSLAPRAGGPTRVLQQLARIQVEQGLDVTICTTNADNPSGTLTVPSNQPLQEHGVTVWYHNIQFAPLLVSIPLARWLREHISEFDIIHVHGLYRFPPSYAGWLAGRRNIPYLIRPHGGLDPYLHQQSSVSIRAKRWYEQHIDLPNLNRAAAIQFSSPQEAERAAFLKLKAPPVFVPNGLDWDDYHQLAEAGAFRAGFDIPASAPLLLFVGRISFVKGLDLLIPAFAALLKHIDNAMLAIVGPDNEGLQSKLQQQCREAGVSDQVIFTGHLAPAQVRQAYRDADLFVLPSHSENFGMTVIEAMACECPVLISDRVNICDAVRDASAGRVVGLDITELGNAMVDLLTERASTQKMAATGREFVRQHYSWDSISGQLTSAYEQLLAQHANRPR